MHIAVKGDARGSFYIVVRGRVEVLQPGTARVVPHVLEDGDYFGEIIATFKATVQSTRFHLHTLRFMLRWYFRSAASARARSAGRGCAASPSPPAFNRDIQAPVVEPWGPCLAQHSGRVGFATQNNSTAKHMANDGDQAKG